MNTGAWFWIIYVVVAIVGGWRGLESGLDRRWLGGGFVVYVLIGLLGWGIFGSPLK